MKLNWDIDTTWTLFLDRDGVINERILDGYILSIKDFIFKEDVLESARLLFGKFAHVFIVTNQQCVGKGLISKASLDDIHDWMSQQFIKEKAYIDEVFVATELNNKDSKRRKPNVEMGLEAQKKFPNVDFDKSIMIGDTDSDISFGQNLGMKTVLIKSEQNCQSSPDLILDSLSDLNKILS